MKRARGAWRAHPDPRTLASLGEWAAMGFYEGISLPWPRSYGLAFRRLYERMPVTVPDSRLLIPHEPFSGARTMESHRAWSAESLICDFNHHCGLRVNAHLAEEKKRAFPKHAAQIDALVADLRTRLPHFGGYTHSNPDIRRVVGEGFRSMVLELDRELDAVRAQGASAKHGELDLLLALKDYTAGVEAFYGHTLEALAGAVRTSTGSRRRDLTAIEDALRHSFMIPAETLLQGLLAVHFTWMLDGCDSIGRFDQVLGPLYERDMAAGRLDPEFMRRLLDEFWQSFERLNGWNLQIGGWTPEGRDGTNGLTMECLDACARNRLRRPNVAFRVTSQTPDRALMRALEALRDGSGRPALYNDDLYVKTLLALDLGLTPEDAREIGFGGCTETMIAGLSNVGSLDGEINLAKALELALHDGFDPVTGEQAGPHTGAFESFADFGAFLEAVKRQILYATDTFCSGMSGQLRRRFSEGDPKLYRTFFTRDCVTRHRSFEAGGARYNWSVVSYQGIANLVDSLAAVRLHVFEDRSIDAAALIRALRSNFEGDEPLRQKLSRAPKFGNDMDAVDGMAGAVIRFAWETLQVHETPRGGRYLPSCILFATYGAAGQRVGALPDGRKAFEVLTDSVGPAQGRDTRGPTAMLASVARLPLSLAVGTPVLNVRFQKSVLASPKGLRSVADLVRSFFAEGGMQIQLSVVSREDLMAAQKNPAQHSDLIVRIGGYSEFFTRLDRGLQDSVIARTEHGV